MRPGIIYGTRYVNNVGVPLGAVFGPMEKLLNFLPNKQLAGIPLIGAALVPPVSVEAVGKVIKSRNNHFLGLTLRTQCDSRKETILSLRAALLNCVSNISTVCSGCSGSSGR